MSRLYPRLLKARAKALAAEYRSLAIDDLAHRWATSDDSAVFVATGGARISTDGLAEVREMVVFAAESAGFPGPLTTIRKTSFDLTLAEQLHREMNLAPVEAASGDVWAFLALVLLPDVAHWRYPNPPGDRVLGSDLTRHVFGRLWWRAQLVHDPWNVNPYGALKILGESSFDQIYARRSALGGSPHLIKSILRVWSSLALDGLSERETIRDFLKRLLRLGPFVSFDAITADALDTELRAIAWETVYASHIEAGFHPDEAAANSDRAACRDSGEQHREPTGAPANRAS
ncbi:DUF6339 family protein [Nocardia sp. BMG111209]|uniref:DUF6339 family protein n=1 Tax=Nocardia sp. BMG111209 TaxID=1160137 RepID=UPI0012DC34D3|nr:DUF6339 family protein [Nocardia sp. BMG111209]